ncbi:hypothetical protein [Bradyrhizobium elkanii]|uniref:hypothetical protein n=2 Tax=Bradyrhizobium elkanii TaxID=29448 RepID=UPI0027146F89|nr:hypothetical protein [Bradyrhizobium elkanii]MCS3882091.1 hypothetical protein [Bradyrhizobium elkanii]MCS4218851.1 hypothetical protein [Bradyrhizobium elkanii]MCW2194527.1 hypothetical protein [Bradyrhizobium elkanii]MCW2210133.1 hypothetical protein [Bradyrhizobium elkanii]
MRRIVGMRGVFLDLLLMGALGLMIDLDRLDGLGRGRRGGGFDHSNDGIGRGVGNRRLAHLGGVVVIMGMIVIVMTMIVVAMIVVVTIILPMIMVMLMVLVMRMIMRLMLVAFVGNHAVIVVPGIMFVMLGIDGMFVGLDGGQRLGVVRALDHLALDALAMAAATGIAMARPAAMAAVLVLFLGLAVGALVGFDQRLTVGDRDLVVVGMDFAEGQEAVPVAAILDEGGLQRRLYARNLGEINVAAQLFALGGLEIKLFDAIATDHDDPGLFRVGGIDQHLVGHFGALDGGGRGSWRAQTAPPGDATVHLIRG